MQIYFQRVSGTVDCMVIVQHVLKHPINHIPEHPLQGTAALFGQGADEDSGYSPVVGIPD